MGCSGVFEPLSGLVFQPEFEPHMPNDWALEELLPIILEIGISIKLGADSDDDPIPNPILKG